MGVGGLHFSPMLQVNEGCRREGGVPAQQGRVVEGREGSLETGWIEEEELEKGRRVGEGREVVLPGPL